MSVVFVFEIKGAKKDKIFNFLKGSFSVMLGPMDMIFGMFSETYVRLLTGISSQFFSRYSKSHNNLNVDKLVKTPLLLIKRQSSLGPPNYMYLIELL